MVVGPSVTSTTLCRTVLKKKTCTELKHDAVWPKGKAYLPKVSFTAIRLGKQPPVQPGIGTAQEPWKSPSYLFVFFSPLPVSHLNWLRCQGSDGLSLPSAYGHLSCQPVNGSSQGIQAWSQDQETRIRTEHEGHESNGVGQKLLNK